jgi:hypothetical protein
MSIDEFKIRFDLICEKDFMKTVNWRGTDAATLMASVCRQKGLWKPIRYLYSELLNSGTVGGDVWHETQIKDDWRRMKEELLSDLYCGGGNFYYLQEAGDAKHLEEFSHGYNLCQPGIEIRSDHEAFNTLFAFRFSSTLDKVSFLDYHLTSTFNTNWRVFSFRLIEVKQKVDSGNREFIDEYIKTSASAHSINGKPKSGQGNLLTTNITTTDTPGRRQAVKITWEDVTEHADQLKEAIRTILKLNFANKTKRIVQVVAFISLESKVNYNASAFADLIFNEFGSELGIKIGSLRKAISPNEIKDLEVNSKIKTLLKPLVA